MNNIMIGIEGFLKIYDPSTNEIFVDKKNAINYENFSQAMAATVANRNYGTIVTMAFGNGAASVDQTGLITYLPPNTLISDASLYNQTYSKVIDDNLITNSDPVRNKMSLSHDAGKLYTDINIVCTLDYQEPSNQLAFDNSTSINTDYTFNEIAIMGNWGRDSMGNEINKLLTHVVFHPVQKSMNRQIQIDYTIRIQAITNLVTM